LGLIYRDKALSYSAESTVIRAVRGKTLNRTNDSTKFPHSEKVTKHCQSGPGR